jgi:protochlorophyllide reductase
VSAEPGQIHADRARSGDTRRAIVTGATSGIGFHTACGLVTAGFAVTLAVRSTERGRRAEAAIRGQHPDALLRVDRLDLANLASIRDFAARWLDVHGGGPHVLVNNAGVISPRQRTTAEGFELMIGTNHLGHFALTGHLVAGLSATGQTSRVPARVITVTSLALHVGRLRPDTWSPSVDSRHLLPWTGYAQSKFANALFSVELQRRLTHAGMPVDAVLVHPGFAVTNVLVPGLSVLGEPGERGAPGFRPGLGKLAGRLLVPTAAEAAGPVIYAATSATTGGMFVGPTGRWQIRGEPGVLPMPRRIQNPMEGRALWHASEQATDVHFLDEPDGHLLR